MSYYYQYYIGYEENGKLYPYGPFDCQGKIKPVVCKSRSFASNLYTNFWVVKEEQITDELRNFFEYEDWNGNKKVEMKYLPLGEMPNGDYIKKGYFLIDDVQAWEQGGDDELFYHMITPLIYAEKLKKEVAFGKNQPQKDEDGIECIEPNASDYMYYAVPQYESEEYESWLIKEAANMLYDYDFFRDDNRKIVILETEG